ncbi:MAG: aspartyl-tRNA amidotransferase [Clostridium sp. 28_12]|jgi:gatB/yqeY domain protein|nr:MAG: aspartyl-tRNA amidotransferase [Clostridium sp. 28_12]
MLKEKLMEDLKESMKTKDTVRKNAVQMVRASILQIEKDKGIEVEDEKIIDIIAKEVKTKRDALKDFEKAERQDLIDLTNREIEILQEYLPKQLSRDEVKAEVQKIISEIGATSMKDMGAIMKEAKAKMGASAEGKTINEVAKEILKL